MEGEFSNFWGGISKFWGGNFPPPKRPVCNTGHQTTVPYPSLCSGGLSSAVSSSSCNCASNVAGLRRTEVQQNNISSFYRSLSSSTHGSVKDLACRLLSEFGSTYLCEQTFSIMNMNKNKLRSNLTDNNLFILRLATTKLEPNVDKVVDSIQAQRLTEY